MMRRVSLSHRVALGWLFDGINLDPKMQINYIDNKHQLADILTKGNFTRDECNNLLRVFNIRNLSSVCCFETSCPTSVSKRLQEGTGQKERVMAKSKPMITVVSMTVGMSSTMPSSSASGIPGGDQGKKFIITIIISSTERDLWQESRLQNMASSSQARQWVYVKELGLFVTVELFGDSPAVLSLWKLCQKHRYFHECTSGQLRHLVQNGRCIRFNTENHMTIVDPELSTGSYSSTASTSSMSFSKGPAIAFSESASGEAQGDLWRSRKAKSRSKDDGTPGARGNPLHVILEWLEDFGQKSCGRRMLRNRGAHPQVLLKDEKQPRQ